MTRILMLCMMLFNAALENLLVSHMNFAYFKHNRENMERNEESIRCSLNNKWCTCLNVLGKKKNCGNTIVYFLIYLLFAKENFDFPKV